MLAVDTSCSRAPERHVVVPGNVLKELCSPAGAVIQASAFTLGDPSVSLLELWGAEYQESNALLVRPQHRRTLLDIARREKCDVNVVGKITGDGRVSIAVVY